MKGTAPKILVSVGSLALAVLGAEAWLRVDGYDPLDSALNGRVQLVRESRAPGRGYELVPLARGEGWGTFVEVNARGFRGPDVLGPVKQDDLVRIRLALPADFMGTVIYLASDASKRMTRGAMPIQ